MLHTRSNDGLQRSPRGSHNACKANVPRGLSVSFASSELEFAVEPELEVEVEVELRVRVLELVRVLVLVPVLVDVVLEVEVVEVVVELVLVVIVMVDVDVLVLVGVGSGVGAGAGVVVFCRSQAHTRRPDQLLGRVVHLAGTESAIKFHLYDVAVLMSTVLPHPPVNIGS